MWDFSKQVNPWFRSKIGNFSIFFIFGKLGQEIVFYGILERKNALLDYNNRKFKKSKNWDFFFKGLVHGFGQKLAIFLS